MLLAALLLCAPGCAKFSGRRARKAAAAATGVPQAIPVGTITLVDEPGKFVLIDSGSLPGPPAGSVLKSYAAGVESGELVTSQVRKHPFSIADIRSGQPHKGDRVRMEPGMATPAPAVVKPAASGAMP